MLVSETQEVTRIIRNAIWQRYGNGNHFMDTSDTLCYATYENQEAARHLLKEPLDLALVVGGYNSSNTGQIVSMCQEIVPTYFISSRLEIISQKTIRHFDMGAQAVTQSDGWLPSGRPLKIALTAGASCPDILLDQVIRRVTELVSDTRTAEAAIEEFAAMA